MTIQSLFDPIAYLKNLENASPRRRHWLTSLLTYTFLWKPAFILDSDILKIDPLIPEVSQIKTRRDIEQRHSISQFLTAYRRTFYPAIQTIQDSTQWFCIKKLALHPFCATALALSVSIVRHIFKSGLTTYIKIFTVKYCYLLDQERIKDICHLQLVMTKCPPIRHHQINL